MAKDCHFEVFMSNIDSVGGVIRALKPYLRQYLEQSGIKVSKDGKFICPSPEKHDTTPSASLVPESNGTVFRCFGCNITGDILKLANLKEGLPLRGKEFITKTVYSLARRFGIPFLPSDLSDQDAETFDLYQIYEDAYSVLRTYWKNRTHVNKRGWSEGMCYQMGVATVNSWDDFIAKLKSFRNYSAAELTAADIKPKLFNSEVITFTLFDEFGRPIGFAARDTRYGSTQGARKYINTATNMVYHKDNVLYGFHIARQQPGPLIIVEGYADVLTAMTTGIYGVSAVCGSTPTQKQIDLIERYNKRDIILTLDYDVKLGPDGKPTGQSKTEKFINEYAKGRRNARLRVTDWQSLNPTDKVDLDEYLVNLKAKGLTPEQSLTAWEQLPKLDGFDWRLKNFADDKSPEEITQEMVPIIALEPICAKQESLLKILSTRTGVRLEALQRDLDSILDLRTKEVTDGIRSVADRLMSKLRYASPEEAEDILQEAHSSVKQIVDGTVQAKVDVGTSIEAVSNAMTMFEKPRTEALAGVKTGFPVFDDEMSGLCSGMWIFGGFSSAGKTSSAAQISWNVLNLNEDAITLVMTLDDTTAEFVARYMAIQTGMHIGQVVDPNRYVFNDPGRTLMYNTAKAKIMEYMASGRLEIRDASVATTSGALVKWVGNTRKRYPGKKIVVILDNFHNLSDKGDSETVRFSRASKNIKNMTSSEDVCIILSAELGKNQDRENPTRKALKETGTLEYDAKGIIMVHNDLIINPQSPKFWTDSSEPDPLKQRKPILDWNIEKNKNLYGVFTGTVPIQFDPPRSKLTQMKLAPRLTSVFTVAQPPTAPRPTGVARKWN